MKAKDLIKMLQACHPEAEILTKWMGDSQESMDYRHACCWLAINEKPDPQILQSFSIVGAEFQDASETQCLEGLQCTLLLEQDFWVDHVVNDAIKVLRDFNAKEG